MSQSRDGRGDPSMLRYFPAFKMNIITDSASFNSHQSLALSCTIAFQFGKVAHPKCLVVHYLRWTSSSRAS